MLIKKLIIGLLSFYAFDFKRQASREDVSWNASSFVERSVEEKKKKEAERKKIKLNERKKYIPKDPYVQKTLKIKGSNPKDLRFSNQKRLRRMYRNS